MQNKWDKRYSRSEYIYGKNPNTYLEDKLKGLTPGKILFPADGEGRNSVFAAKKGWNAYSFDSSKEGKRKAELLASSQKVQLDYKISDALEIDYSPDSFDAMALIYAHFPSDIRRKIHRKLTTFIKPGGYLILEAFNKNQVENQRKNPNAGGPPIEDMLYSLHELLIDFEDFEFSEAKETQTELQEGNHHIGKGAVVRLFGKRKE